MGRRECTQCGGVGYTILRNAHDEEFIDGCDACWEAEELAEIAEEESND